MFGRRKQPSLMLDVLVGAAAGAAGTWLMSPAMQGISKLQDETSRKQEEAASFEENATVKTAKRLAKPLGVELRGKRKQKAGMAVHWAYGTLWGAAYALMLRRNPGRAGISGLALGAFLWFFGDEVMVPALKLAPGPEKMPFFSHVKALGAHLAYGAGADAALRTLRRAYA